MRLNVITDDKGYLIAATPGVVGESETTVAEAVTKADSGGGVVLLSGQTVRQVEVPDTLFNVTEPETLQQHLAKVLST